MFYTLGTANIKTTEYLSDFFFSEIHKYVRNIETHEDSFMHAHLPPQKEDIFCVLETETRFLKAINKIYNKMTPYFANLKHVMCNTTHEVSGVVERNTDKEPWATSYTRISSVYFMYPAGKTVLS
jgi:hypothetical protein